MRTPSMRILWQTCMLLCLAQAAWAQNANETTPAQQTPGEQPAANDNGADQQPAANDNGTDKQPAGNENGGSQQPPANDNGAASQQPAAEPPAQQPQPAAVEAPASLPTTEEVQARLTQVEAATELSESARNDAIAQYRKALDQIAAYKSWNQKIEEYRRNIEAAPSMLEDVRKELDERLAQKQAPKIEGQLEELTSQLTQSELELKSREEAVTQLENESRLRTERRTVVPEQAVSTKARLDAVDRELLELGNGGQPPAVQQAKRTQLTCQREALRMEALAYQRELSYYDARQEVLKLRLDLARLKLDQQQELVKALRARVSEERAAVAARQKAQARQNLDNAPEPIRELVSKTEQLAEERAELAAKIHETETDLQEYSANIEELKEDLDRVRNYVTQVTTQDALGPLLREQRSRVFELQRLDRELVRAQTAIAKSIIRSTEIDGQRIVDLNSHIRDRLDTVQTAIQRELTEDEQRIIRESMESRKKILDGLYDDYDRYVTTLNNLSIQLQSLIAKRNEIRDFVDEHVLWTRSAQPIHRMVGPTNPRSVYDALGNVLASVPQDFTRNPTAYAGTLIIVIGLYFFRIPARKKIAEWGDLVSRAHTDRYEWTVRTFIYTGLLALPLPFLLYAIGSRLRAMSPLLDNDYQYDLAASLDEGAIYAAVTLFGLMLIRQTCRKFGLASKHFQWDRDGLKSVRTHLAWYAPVAVFCAAIIATAEAYSDNSWRDSVGRVAMLLFIGATGLLMMIQLRPNVGGLARIIARKSSTGAHRPIVLLRLATVLLVFGLAAASCIGYEFTAVTLSTRVTVTAWLFFLVFMMHALAIRWVVYNQRKIAIAEAMEKRNTDDVSSSSAEEQPQLRIADIGAQTRGLLQKMAIFALFVAFWFSWSDLFPALRFLDDVTLWSHATTVPGTDGNPATSVVLRITLANLVMAGIVGLAAVVLSRNIPGLLEIAILRKLSIDAGMRYAVTSLCRYSITVIGVIVVFSSLGVRWSDMQWLVAAVSVGLGFGLQEIFANFVSGLIMLFERPIRIGDIVTVGQTSGTVTRIRIRATTITDWDRKELIIPNKEFITGQVVNWSLSDEILRIVISVGVAYGSDTKLARKTLLDVAAQCAQVLDDPAPQAFFLGFGSSSLDFELRAFVKRIDDWIVTRNDLHFAVDDAFRKAKIEIAFPQRDIHIRTVSKGAITEPDALVDTSAKPEHGEVAERKHAGSQAD